MTAPAPVACRLSDRDQARRAQELEKEFFSRVARSERRRDGYSLYLRATPANRRLIDEFVAFEGECCPFLETRVEEAGAGEIELSLGGPEGTVEFLDAWIPASEPEPEPQRRGRRRAGYAGVAAALTAFVCCATPILATLLLAFGVTASARVSGWVDITAIVVLVASLWLLLGAKRAAEKTPGCGC